MKQQTITIIPITHKMAASVAAYLNSYGAFHCSAAPNCIICVCGILPLGDNPNAINKYYYSSINAHFITPKILGFLRSAGYFLHWQCVR
jgi:hypothetical protein